jgi:hypothetical protein
VHERIDPATMQKKIKDGKVKASRVIVIYGEVLRVILYRII